VLWDLGTSGTQSLPVEDGRAVVLAYFPDVPDVARLLRAAVSALDAAVVPAEIATVDWVARVREGFRPFSAGGFRIVPAWEATPIGTPTGGHDGPVLVVEPGLAFGTGSHESTRLCLTILSERAREAPLGDVLDVGAGSGILSAAAAVLGAARVVAVEVDPEALPVAARHAELNRAAIRLVQGDGARPVRPASFDLVLANISAALLVERAPELAAARRPGGCLVLSGFLREDVADVGAAYARRGEVDVRVEGDWAALVIRSPR
jgi:ribosomal protein L11 methyltransferase